MRAASATSASVKSYQLVKVVSGGRAPGKSSSLASPQLLVIEQFHCFGAVRLEKVHFFLLRWFLKNIFDHSFKGALLACCLPAASLLLACYLLLLAAACCCLPVAAHLLLTCCSAAAHLLLACCFLLHAAANPLALQEIWGCTNRGLIWSRDAGHQYNIFKSNRISCREFVCINLCPSKSSLCAMLRLLLTTSPSMDETGCAMVILLPWCDFPLPDVTSPYRRRAMGMMWLFPPDVT